MTIKKPSTEKRNQIRQQFDKDEVSYILGKKASQLDRAKFALCEDIAKYLKSSGLTQRALAQELDIEEARISEIVNFKVWLINTDNLFIWHEKICPHITTIRMA
jgi:predicted XRE-type DNA-binding protein